jgi:hypothetical protein
MKERIRLLAEQCWEERPEGQLHFDNEKFAELLLFECTKIAVFKGDATTAMAIKEHFAL